LGIEATTYDWAVEHEHIAGLFGGLIWATAATAEEQLLADGRRDAERPSDS
jgi:hypothetical protein